MNITYVKKRKPTIVSNGLVIHLDASKPNSYPGTGTTWYDISGYGNDFIAQSSTEVTWDSTNKYFQLNGNTGSFFKGPKTNATGLSSVVTYTTIFLVCKVDDYDNPAVAFDWWQTGSGRAIRLHVPYYYRTGREVVFDIATISSTGRLNYGQSGIGDSGILQVSPEPNVVTQTTTAAYWTFRSQTTTPRRSIWYNDTEIVNSGTRGTTTTWVTNNNHTVLGSFYQSSTGLYGVLNNLWRAKIWGFYLYNRGLSNLELQKMRKYLDYTYKNLYV